MDWLNYYSNMLIASKIKRFYNQFSVQETVYRLNTKEEKFKYFAQQFKVKVMQCFVIIC